MKIAALDNDGNIWGIGNTQTEAMQDAFKWLQGASYGYGDEAGDYAAMSWEEFVESKQYDRFVLRDITDAAAAVVKEYGGLWHDLDDELIYSAGVDDTIMTLDEFRAKYGDD